MRPSFLWHVLQQTAQWQGNTFDIHEVLITFLDKWSEDLAKLVQHQLIDHSVQLEFDNVFRFGVITKLTCTFCGVCIPGPPQRSSLLEISRDPLETLQNAVYRYFLQRNTLKEIVPMQNVRLKIAHHKCVSSKHHHA